MFSWNYSFIEKNLTMLFTETVNARDLLLGSINITSNTSTVPDIQLNGLGGATTHLVNSTVINVTLTEPQDTALRTYSGVWQIRILQGAINDIAGEGMSGVSGKGYGTLTDYYILKPSTSPFAIGVTSFVLPLSILDDNEANVSLSGNRSTTKVLESVNPNYNAIYALNDGIGGTGGWTSYVVGRATNDFLQFATDNTTYWVNMTAQDRLEIGRKTVKGE